MTEAAVPVLPQEAWDLVLKNHFSKHTVPEMWIHLRHVNTKFKKTIETLFAKEILPKASINVDLGETWDEDRGRVILNAGFDFKRLSDDETMAIFEMDEAAEEYHSEMRGGLRFFQAGINIDLEKPIHNIIIRHDLTDGPLPGPSIDLDKFELSVDWKAMLTPFYSEIFLTTKTNREFVASSEERMAGIKAQLEAGQLDMMTVMLQAMQEFGDSNDRGLKRGRRARIIKQYREGITQQPNFTAQDLDEDLEKEVLLSLAKARQFLGFCDDEDDESEEEDDEDEEGDSEEDEWEDDDGEDEDENADSDVE